jgi:Cu(I)/Ag(I) efflux system protein CusF
MKARGLAPVATAALVAAMAVLGSASFAQAQTAPAPAGLAAAADLSDGEVRKIDKDSGKLTIKHGPLKRLDMPGMTMVFGVSDAAWLDQLSVGQKLRFQAEKIDGKFVVTQIEVAPN